MNGSSREPQRDVVRRTPARHRADPAVVAGQQGDDAVRLTQLVGAQHDRLVAVERHPAILPHGRAGVPDVRGDGARGRLRPWHFQSSSGDSGGSGAIGAGGFASVWLYRDEELDSPVAVKVLADNWAQDPDIRTRFVEESRLLRRAGSDHVVAGARRRGHRRRRRRSS